VEKWNSIVRRIRKSAYEIYQAGNGDDTMQYESAEQLVENMTVKEILDAKDEQIFAKTGIEF
jgi:hypothetical protein